MKKQSPQDEPTKFYAVAHSSHNIFLRSSTKPLQSFCKVLQTSSKDGCPTRATKASLRCHVMWGARGVGKSWFWASHELDTAEGAQLLKLVLREDGIKIRKISVRGACEIKACQPASLTHILHIAGLEPWR